MSRKSLSEILEAGSDRDQLRRNCNEVKPADDFGIPLPKGKYIARIVDGELFTAKTGTPGYKLSFEIAEGDYAGRKLWHDIWLSEAALSIAKRDLNKLGVTSLEQLEQPLPRGIRCEVMLVVREEDDGSQRNHVRSFEVIGVDAPEPNPFAPANDGTEVTSSCAPTATTSEPPPVDVQVDGDNPVDVEERNA